MKPGWRGQLAGILALTWLMAITSAYFIYHKPISAVLVIRGLLFAGQFLSAFALLAIGGALGRFLTQRVFKTSLGQDATLQAALGLGGLSLLWLASGATLGYTVYFAWGLLLGLALLLRKELLSWWQSLKAYKTLWRPQGRLEKALALISCPLLLATLIVAAVPPLKFDALVYHLALPQRYLEAGRLVYVGDNPFWGMPQIGEMLYTWCMTLAGLACAPIFGWMLACLGLLGLRNLVKEHFGDRYGWIALACLLAGFTLASSTAWAYVDWMAFLFAVGMLAAFQTWQNSFESKYIALAGTFAGLALGSKYTAGILIPVGCVVLVWGFYRGRKFHNGWEHTDDQSSRSFSYRHIILGLLSFAGLALMVSTPWWLKNILATGHPFYPIWGFNQTANPFQLGAGSGARTHQSWWQIMFLPVGMTVQGVEGTPGYSASIGPLLIGLAPFAFLGWVKRDANQKNLLWLTGVMSFIGLAGWMVAAHLAGLLEQPRLYYALFPAFSVLAAGGFFALERVKMGTIRLGRVFGFLVLLVYGLNLIQVMLSCLSSTAPQQLVALSSSQSYLVENLGWYTPAMQAINDLPQDARVLMLWEARSLYCLPRCSPDPFLDRWWQLENQMGDNSISQDIPGYLRSEGYTYVLYYKLGSDFVRNDDHSYSPSDWHALDNFLASMPEPAVFGDAYMLYALR